MCRCIYCLLWLIALLVGSSGCGFQLRGALTLPPQFTPVYVQPGSMMSQVLLERLRVNQIPVTDQPATAQLTVQLRDETQPSRLVAVDQYGKGLAYELRYRIRYALQPRQGPALLPLQTLTMTRLFDDQPDAAVLGKQLEADMISRDLIAEAADSIIASVRAVFTQPPPR